MTRLARVLSSTRLLTAQLVLSLGGCHDFTDSVCMDCGGSVATSPCQRDGGSTSSWSDCDGSEVTWCETDVLLDPQHCGECNHACDDLCLGGSCIATEQIFASSFELLHAPVAFSTDDIYVIALSGQVGGAGREIHVVSKTAPQDRHVLASKLAIVDDLLLGIDRLYMRDTSGSVFSIGLSASGDLRNEDLRADAYAISDTWLVWLDDKVLKKRDLATHEEVELLRENTWANETALAASRNRIVLGLPTPNGGHELHIFDALSKTAVVKHGPGRIAQLHVTDDLIFALVGDDASDLSLISYGNADQAPRKIDTRGRFASLLANDGYYLYAATTTGEHGALDVFALGNASFHVASGLRSDVQWMQADDSYLYFIPEDGYLTRISTESIRNQAAHEPPVVR